MPFDCRAERLSPYFVRLLFEGDINPSLTRYLVEISKRLAQIEDIKEVTHGYRTLLVETTLPPEEVRDCVGRILPLESLEEAIQVHELEVDYDGPDLKFVAAHLGCSVEEVIIRHAGNYHVVALGSPGFIYLSLTRELTVPRLDTPRRRVPPGAVGIAGKQTGIYGSERPGGWRIIGNCATFPPMQPGNEVRFHPA